MGHSSTGQCDEKCLAVILNWLVHTPQTERPGSEWQQLRQLVSISHVRPLIFLFRKAKIPDGTCRLFVNRPTSHRTLVQINNQRPIFGSGRWHRSSAAAGLGLLTSLILDKKRAFTLSPDVLTGMIKQQIDYLFYT